MVNESLSERQLANDFWMPHGDLFNGYVQVGVWSGNDLHHDGQRCFTNPWGHTWGLNRISSIDHVCCVYGEFSILLSLYPVVTYYVKTHPTCHITFVRAVGTKKTRIRLCQRVMGGRRTITIIIWF